MSVTACQDIGLAPYALSISGEIRYGNAKILQDVDLTATLGDRVGIVGPNGSGKSTLLRIVAGSGPPNSSAQVAWSNEVLGGQPPIGASLLPELPSTATLTVRQLLKAVDDRCSGTCESPFEILRRLGYPMSATRKRISALSAGNRQRLSLAVAMSGTPNVVLLDEPTAALDDEGQNLLLNLLYESPRMLTLIASHDLAFLGNWVSRAWILDGSGLCENQAISNPTTKSRVFVVQGGRKVSHGELASFLPILNTRTIRDSTIVSVGASTDGEVQSAATAMGLHVRKASPLESALLGTSRRGGSYNE